MPITRTEIVRGWFPLAVTWWMMAAELPFISALVARLPNSELNLAAVGVMTSLVFIFESPILLLLSAATALVENKSAYRRLRHFTLFLGTLMSLCLSCVFLSPVFELVAFRILDLRADLALLVQRSGPLFIPIPFAVAYRRFYQGILIRHHRSSLVGAGSLIRFACMAASGAAVYMAGNTDGARLGAVALTAGMFGEALASRVMCQPTVAHLHAPEKDSYELSYSVILRFYLPLALNGIILMAANPMLTFFLAHGAHAIESLAVYPVINSILFFCVSAAIALQEVIISRLGKNHEHFVPLKSFATTLGLVLIVCVFCLFYTTLSYVFFTRVSGFTRSLLDIALPAGRVAALVPLLTVFTIWQRAILIHSRTTVPITIASIMDLLTMGVSMLLLSSTFAAPAATLAFFAVLAGRTSGALTLVLPYRRARQGVTAPGGAV